MNTPYTDTNVSSNVFERIFSADTHDEELEWHRDRRTRFVTVLSGTGWKFQFDNSIPKNIFPGTTIHINQQSYHRLLKGDTDLIVRIVEL